MVLVWFMIAVCSMLPLLPGLHFLGGFGDLAGTGSGREQDGEGQHTKDRQADAGKSVAGHINDSHIWCNSFYEIPF